MIPSSDLKRQIIELKGQFFLLSYGLFLQKIY